MADHIDRFTAAQEKAYAKEIRDIYAQAAREVREKVEAFMAKHRARADELLQQVKDGRITMGDYQAWMRGQVFQGKRWEQRLRDITQVYVHADEKARAILNGTQRTVFTEAANYAAYEISRDVGGAVSFTLFNEETLDKLARKNPKMLPEWKINEEKDYIWNEKRVQNAVTQAVIQGESIPALTKRLTGELATDNAKKMAMFARTAMTGAQNAGRIERLEETQEMGVRVKKKWLAAHDNRVRDTHAELDGQERDVDEPFEVVNDHGERLEIDYPGDPNAAPELTYNCRCTLIYVYPDFPSHSTHHFESYKEWKKRAGEAG